MTWQEIINFSSLVAAGVAIGTVLDAMVINAKTKAAVLDVIDNTKKLTLKECVRIANDTIFNTSHTFKFISF